MSGFVNCHSQFHLISLQSNVSWFGLELEIAHTLRLHFPMRPHPCRHLLSAELPPSVAGLAAIE